MLPQKKQLDLLFVDTETTGLDPLKHELIEVAAIRTSPDGRNVLSIYKAKLRPTHAGDADPQALKINGYTPEEWTPEKCETPLNVVNQLTTLALDTMLVGHNVSFDERFLLPLFQNYNFKPPWSYHKIDTVALAYPLYLADPRLTKLSLGPLCEYFGMPAPKHNALADVTACREVFLELMQRYTVRCARKA